MLCHVTVSVVLLHTLCSVAECEGKGPGRIHVNNEKIHESYDPGYYPFINGEIVDITCFSKGDYSQLKYYTNSGDLVLTTVMRYETATVRLKLRKPSQESYVVCFSGVLQHQTTHMSFRMKTTDESNNIEVYINNTPINVLQMYYLENTFSHTHRVRPTETVDLVCRKKFKNNLMLMLDHNRERESVSNSNTSLSISNFTENQDVVCRLMTQKQVIEETVNIELKVDFTDFYITGLQSSNITEEYTTESNVYFMKYEYSEDEDLTLVCKHSRGPNHYSINWKVNGEARVIPVSFKSNIYTSELQYKLKAKHDNSTIQCQLANDTNVEKIITIQFIYIPTNGTPQPEGTSDFIVTGLPITNITEYTNDTNAIFMKYEYSGEEELDLVCTKHVHGGQRIPQLIWLFNDVLKNSSEPSYTSSSYSSNVTIKLIPDHDNSTLRCAETSDDSIVKQITIQFTYKSSHQKAEDEGLPGVGGNIDPTVLVVAGCFALVSIVSVSCFMWCRVRRNKDRQRLGVGEDNENLPSCNSSLPHPSQWQEPTYTEVSHNRPGASCGPLYQNNTTKPSPQIHPNKKPEGEYANIQDQTYEAVGGVKELNYVELSFAKGVRTNRPTVAGEDTLYSEVVGVKSKGSKYDNVFDNSRYVNTHHGEYAEPAYCEPLNNK